MARAEFSLSRKLEEELTCAVCFELFANPVLLSCSHSYCKKCIQDLVRNNEEIGRYDTRYARFQCPICRTSISLKSPRSIDTLPENLALANLVCVLKTSGGAAPKWKVPNLDHAECGKHPGNNISIFCWDCCKTLCPSCATGCHGHKLAALENVWRNTWEHLRDLLDEANGQRTAIDNRVRLLDVQLKAFDDAEKAAKTELEVEIEILKSVLSSRLAHLNSEVHGEVQDVKYPLTHDREQCVAVQGSLVTSSGRVHALLRGGNDGVQLVKTVVKLETDLTNLLHQRVPHLLKSTIPAVSMPTWQLLRENAELSIRTLVIRRTGPFMNMSMVRADTSATNSPRKSLPDTMSSQAARPGALSGAGDERASSANRRTLRPVRSLKTRPESLTNPITLEKAEPNQDGQKNLVEFRSLMHDGFKEIMDTLENSVDSCVLEDSDRKTKSLRSTKDADTKYGGGFGAVKSHSFSFDDRPHVTRPSLGRSSSPARRLSGESTNVFPFGKPVGNTSQQSNVFSWEPASNVTTYSGFFPSAVPAQAKSVQKGKSRPVTAAGKSEGFVFGAQNIVFPSNPVSSETGTIDKTRNSIGHSFNIEWKPVARIAGEIPNEPSSADRTHEGSFPCSSFNFPSTFPHRVVHQDVIPLVTTSSGLASTMTTASPLDAAGKSGLFSPLTPALNSAAAEQVRSLSPADSKTNGTDLLGNAKAIVSSRSSTPCRDEPGDRAHIEVRSGCQTTDVADDDASTAPLASTSTLESSSGSGTQTADFTTTPTPGSVNDMATPLGWSELAGNRAVPGQESSRPSVGNSPIHCEAGPSAGGQQKMSAAVNVQTTKPQTDRFSFPSYDGFQTPVSTHETSHSNDGPTKQVFRFSMTGSETDKSSTLFDFATATRPGFNSGFGSLDTQPMQSNTCSGVAAQILDSTSPSVDQQTAGLVFSFQNAP